jgi:hypothetical protein
MRSLLALQAVLADNGAPKKIRPCNLDKSTQSFVKLIFDKDMFKSAMAKFEIGAPEHVLPVVLLRSLPLSCMQM